MNNREDYMLKYQAQVNSWGPKVDGIKSRAQSLSDEARRAVQPHLDAVDTRFQAVTGSLRDINASPDDRWDGVQATADRSWSEFKRAVEGAYTVLKTSTREPVKPEAPAVAGDFEDTARLPALNPVATDAPRASSGPKLPLS